MPQRDKILVVEDDASLRETLCQILSKKFEVMAAGNGKTALEMARQHLPVVILLDAILPELDGFKVCSLLRENPITQKCRIIFLTGIGNPEDRTQAFLAGADDYIEKPVTTDELLARVQAKVRRLREDMNASAEKAIGNLTIDLAQMCLKIKGGPTVKIGLTEIKILNVLACAPDRVVSRKELVEKVWSEDEDNRVLDPHITSLRKKLSESNVEIKTVYGEGYSLIVRTSQ